MHPQFFRLKSAGLAFELAQARLQAAFTEARATYQAELTACGLDPALDYQLDDRTQDITPVTAAPPAPTSAPEA